MKRLLMTVLFGGLAASVLLATPAPAAAEDDLDARDWREHWREHWDWYEQEFRPYFTYRYGPPEHYFGDPRMYRYPSWSHRNFNQSYRYRHRTPDPDYYDWGRGSVELGPYRFGWR